jgi:hypothetical protein
MRPKAKNKDLPSTHDVAKYIHNQFVEWLTDLKKEISVSSTIIHDQFPTPLTKSWTEHTW